jgi:competence protein ComEC
MSPAVPLFALASAGALLGLVVEGALLPALLTAALALAAAGRARAPLARAAAVLAFTLAIAAAGAAWQRSVHDATVLALPHGEVLLVEGLVLDRAHTRAGGLRLTLAAEGALREGEPAGQPLPCRLQVWLHGSAAALEIEAGDRLRARGRVRRHAPSDRPGAFDAAAFGLARGLHGSLSAHDAGAVVVVQRRAAGARFARAREGLRRRLLALVTPREAGVLLARLVGDKSLLDDEQLALYRRVGAGHLLAVSGLQVSFLALVLQRLFLPLLVLLPALSRRGYAHFAAALLAAACVWAFVALCGAPPSAVRAAGMATAALCALVGGPRRVRGADALGVAGLVTLLLSPTAVIDPSFLLSYAAVIGLVLAVPPRAEGLFAPELSPQRRRLRKVGAGVMAALAAGLMTLPVSAHLFGEIAPGGLLANVLLVPAAVVLQVPTFGFGFFGALTSSPFLTSLGAAGGGLLEALCAALDGPLGGLVPVGELRGGGALGLSLASALAVLAAVRQSPRTLALSLGVGLVSLAPALLVPGGVRVSVLPVGQGDGAVFELPSGEVMVVDGGGVWDESRDPGVEVLLPFLARRGIKAVELVVLSHPHPDHLLGLLALLDAVPVKELWHSGYSAEQRWLGRLLAKARDKGVRVRAPPELLGEHPFGGALLEVLAPDPGDGAALYEELHENDNSLVLRVRYGADAALWTGDIETWGERYLVASGKDVSAALLKAPHHGSRTSSSPALLDAVRPEHVIFATGRDNLFGFPHAEVSERYRQRGIRIWDTAVHGELTYWLTGRGVKARAFRPE